MRKLFVALLIAAIAVPGSVTVSGQTIFRTELKNKYDLRSVSCFVCHEKVERGVDNPKQFRNDLGKLFDKEFEGQEITAKLDEVKTLDREDPKRVAVEEEVMEQFKAAWEKIKATEAPGGETYEEAFKNATLEGVKGR